MQYRGVSWRISWLSGRGALLGQSLQLLEHWCHFLHFSLDQLDLGFGTLLDHLLWLERGPFAALEWPF